MKREEKETKKQKMINFYFFFLKVIVRNTQELEGVDDDDIHSIFSNAKYGNDIKILKILKIKVKIS